MSFSSEERVFAYEECSFSYEERVFACEECPLSHEERPSAYEERPSAYEECPLSYEEMVFACEEKRKVVTGKTLCPGTKKLPYKKFSAPLSVVLQKNNTPQLLFLACRSISTNYEIKNHPPIL
jgi:hypothetical protein